MKDEELFADIGMGKSLELGAGSGLVGYLHSFFSNLGKWEINC